MAFADNEPSVSDEQEVLETDTVEPISDAASVESDIEELIRQEREAIENVPIVITQDDLEHVSAQEELARLDVPEVGQAFTFDQDAAVFAAMYQAIQQEKADLEEEGLHPVVTYLREGSFLAWNGPDPFIRGFSDSFVRVGIVEYERDGNSFQKQLILDFNFSDLFFTDEYIIESTESEDDDGIDD